MLSTKPVISEIYIYPLKSAGGIQLDHAALSLRGLEFDRRWMLVDAKGQFISQREYARMALLRLSVNDDGFIIRAEGHSDLKLVFELLRQEKTSVTIWSSKLKAWLYPPEYGRWFSKFLGIECHLVAMPDNASRIANPKNTRSATPIRFVDGYPLLLLSEASMQALNKRLPTPILANRFRANIVLRNCEAHAEDSWDRFTIDDIPLETIKRCPRCVVTTIEQETAAKSKEPLRTLAGYRNFNGSVDFGMYARALHDGVVKVGSELEIDSLRSSAA